MKNDKREWGLLCPSSCTLRGWRNGPRNFLSNLGIPSIPNGRKNTRSLAFAYFSSRVTTRLHTTRGHASARSTARADTVGGNVLLTPRLNSSRWSNCHALRRIKPRPSAGGMQIHLIARTIRRRRRRVYRLFPANIRCPGTQAFVQQSSMKTCKFVIKIYIVVTSSM